MNRVNRANFIGITWKKRCY